MEGGVGKKKYAIPVFSVYCHASADPCRDLHLLETKFFFFLSLDHRPHLNNRH